MQAGCGGHVLGQSCRLSRVRARGRGEEGVFLSSVAVSALLGVRSVPKVLEQKS